MNSSRGFKKLKGLASAGALGFAGMLGAGTNRGGGNTVGTSFSLTGDNVVWNGFYNGRSFPSSHAVTTTNGAEYTTETTPAYCITDAVMFENSSTYSNAFDCAMILAVDGILFMNPDSSVTLDGNTVTSDVVTDITPGIDAQIQYRIYTDRKVVRGLYSLTNTTSSSIDLSAAILGDYGSDLDTNIETSSNNNETIENSDLWFITSDLFDSRIADKNTTQGSGSSYGPVVTTTRYGVGAEVIPTNALTPINDGAVYGLRYQLNIPAGTTVRIMVFHELGLPVLASIPNQVADAADFESMTSLDVAGLIDDLDDGIRDTVVNYGDSDVIFNSGFE